MGKGPLSHPRDPGGEIGSQSFDPPRAPLSTCGSDSSVHARCERRSGRALADDTPGRV